MEEEYSANIGPLQVTRSTPFIAGRTAILTVDMQKEYCIPSRDPMHPELDENCYFHKQTRLK